MTLIRCYHSGQSRPGNDGNEGVLRIPQSSSDAGNSLSDYLVSYSGHSLGGGVLALCRETVGVLYSPSRLGKLAFEYFLIFQTFLNDYLFSSIFSYIYIYIYILMSLYLGNKLLSMQVLLKTIGYYLLFLIVIFHFLCYFSYIRIQVVMESPYIFCPSAFRPEKKNYISYTTTTLSRRFTYQLPENSLIKQHLINKHKHSTDQLNIFRHKEHSPQIMQ